MAFDMNRSNMSCDQFVDPKSSPGDPSRGAYPGDELGAVGDMSGLVDNGKILFDTRVPAVTSELFTDYASCSSSVLWHYSCHACLV